MNRFSQQLGILSVTEGLPPAKPWAGMINEPETVSQVATTHKLQRQEQA